MREPPGCPPGPPPDLDEDGEIVEFSTKSVEEEKAVEEDRSSDNESTPVKPTSLQQKMVALSGQNVDEFMKEMETVQKKMETNREEENRTKLTVHIEPLVPPGTDPIPTLPTTTTLPNPPTHLFSNPAGIRLPPGPPPGRPLLPPGPPPGLPPRLPIRMPQMPPRMIRIPGPPSLSQMVQPNVLSAAPQLINRADGSKQQGATISAKPQIRNLSADITRFVPSALRIKREDKKPKSNASALVRELKQKEYTMTQTLSGATKDDAYKQFMQEMEQLL